MPSVTVNSQVSAGNPVGERARPERWPVRSGTVPPLPEYLSPRPETGFDFVLSPAPGATVVLAPPTPPDTAGGDRLAGMGGTGKTQLGAALARFLWGSGAVDLLAWVPAASRDSLLTGYAQAAAAVGADGADEGPEAAAAAFLDWLANTGRPWLVVLDDVADLADLDELWPRGAAGRVLVTTRLSAAVVAGPGRKILQVGPFSPREALSYLTAGLYPDQRTGAIDLARDLGCLPREHFADRKRHMLATHGDRYAAIVAAAWSISLDRADSTSPGGLARPALALVALLDPSGIPYAVLTSRAACDYISGRGATGTPAGESQVRSVLDRLSRVGLVTIDPDSAPRTVGMHSLVQATVQQVIPPAVLRPTAAAAASALLQAWPHRDREPLVAQALRDCAASLHRAAGSLLWTPVTHPLLLRAGQSLDRAGLSGLAISYWRGMVDIGSRVLGPSHASTLLARDHLAVACEATGLPRDAIVALGHNLAERERALGDDHPETLAARARLASAYHAMGYRSEAVALFERTLADCERCLPAGHKMTQTIRENLDRSYGQFGRRL